MNVSVLMRLLPGPLADGRIVGQVDLVDTGERTIVQNASELMSFLQEHALARPPAQPDRQGERPLS